MKNLKIPLVSLLKVLLITLVLSPAAVLSFTSTKVKLHEAASLPCYQTCTGLVTWAHKDDILAQCDQTSCQSEEGFQMSHDEYLKGNLSLTITEADFSKRKWYTCKCDGEGICDVSLRLEPFSYPLSVHVGESLILDLPIPDDVEVTVKKTDGPTTFSLCKIEGHKAWCESGYKQRVSVSSNLRLKEVKNDDGGIYIIRDIKNDEVIGMYTVTVNGTKRDVSDVEGTPPGHTGSVATPLAAVFGVLLVVAILVIILLFVKNQKLKKCLEHAPVGMQQVQQQEQQEEQVKHEPEAVLHIAVMETEDGQEVIEQIKIQQDEADPLLETDSPVNPPSATEEPPLSVPVSESCSQYSDSQTRVFN